MSILYHSFPENAIGNMAHKPHLASRPGCSGGKGEIQVQDLTGQRYGMLTVVGPTEERKNGYAVWHCRCDCGGEILLDSRRLRRGTVTDCGCVSGGRSRRRDVTGMRFGMLTAVEPTGETLRGSAVWRCRCDCGGEVLAPLGQLTAGYRKSCGCLGRPVRKDFVGRRFGRLTVTEYAGKQDGMHRWRCRCDCGNETVVGQTPLQSGKTKSCGCLQSETYRENLKLVDGTSVTMLEAAMDRRIASNTSGYTGVYLDRKRGKWVAQITFKGKTHYLGAYADKEEAVKARRRGEEEFFQPFLEEFAARASPRDAAAGG